MEEATTLLVQARTLGLEVVGVAFHVGSGCSEPYAYYRAVAAARQVSETGQDERERENHTCLVGNVGQLLHLDCENISRIALDNSARYNT